MKRVIVLLAACAPGVPETPSFQQHVAPILAANCVRCHGVPVIGGAPPELRLDTYGSYDRPKRTGIGIEQVIGAQTYASIIAQRVASSDAPMPPRFGLDEYQIETLERWDVAGAPRGAPNPGNHAPTAVVDRVLQSIEEEGIEIRVRSLIDLVVLDSDPDVVGGALQVRRGTTVLPLGLLRSGPNHVEWETTNIAPGSFALEAVLDDGGAEVVVPLGAMEVTAP